MRSAAVNAGEVFLISSSFAPRSLRWAQAAAALVLVWLLAGCAALPPLPPQVPTQALADWSATPLGALPVKTAGDGTELSGFHLLPGGGDSFDIRIELARAAHKTIDAQYYVLRDDPTGRAFLRALRDAAQRGVRVRLLIDDLYTAGEEELLRGFGATPNVEVKLFNPIPARGIGLLSRNLLSLSSASRIGRRMHNKLFIADNAASVSGGRNIADVYFMRQASANFLDLDILAVGPVVRDQSAVFDRFWNGALAYPAGLMIGKPDEPAAARAAFERMTTLEAGSPPVSHAAPSLVDALRTGQRKLTWAPAEVVADDPSKAAGAHKVLPAETALAGSIAAFELARSEVFLISPYFVPGKRGMTVIQRMRDRGVRIVILTNSLAANDEALVFGAYARYRVALLRSGVHISELSPGRAQKRGHFSELGRSTAMLHAKFGIIDRKVLVIGSMNLDPRSADINTEIGLLIDSPELAGELVTALEEDRFESAYRLRLAPDGEKLLWVATEDGVETIVDDEPEVGWMKRFMLFITSPWVPEDLL
jgi:putative cardiolipin synthase